MLAKFTQMMNDAVEKVQTGFVSSWYDDSEKVIEVYFLTDVIGYADIVVDENTINYYAFRNGQPVLLDSEQFGPSLEFTYIDKQASYAEKLAFNELFKQWLAEQD